MSGWGNAGPLRALRRFARHLKHHRWVSSFGTELNYRLRRRKVAGLLDRAAALPRALHVETTNVCNARCVFCAYPQMERAKQTMSSELFADVVEQYVELGGSHVSLTPIVGDPFVDARLFERLDRLSATPEISGFYFFTNAVLMKPELCGRLVAYGRRLRICVSMGGFDRETWERVMGIEGFAAVRRNLEALVAAMRSAEDRPGLEIHLRCADRDLRGETWEWVRDLAAEGRLSIVPLDHYDSWAGAIDDAELLRHGLRPSPMPHKRGPCELLYMKPVVLADGRVNACACRDVEAELIIGDLTRRTVAEVFQGDDLARLRQRQMDGDFPEVCRRCTYYVSVFDPVRGRIAGETMNWEGGFKD